MDDVDVAVDYGAVFEGVDVGGVDGQSVAQLSCSQAVTHCKQGRKQTSTQILDSHLKFS